MAIMIMESFPIMDVQKFKLGQNIKNEINQFRLLVLPHCSLNTRYKKAIPANPKKLCNKKHEK